MSRKIFVGQNFRYKAKFLDIIMGIFNFFKLKNRYKTQVSDQFLPLREMLTSVIIIMNISFG